MPWYLAFYADTGVELRVAFSLLPEQSSLSCTFVSSYFWNQVFTTENLFTSSLPFPFFTYRNDSTSIHAIILLSIKSATGFKETFVMYQILDCDLVTWYWIRDVPFHKSFTNYSSECKDQPIFYYDFYFLDYNYLIFSFPPFNFSCAPIYFQNSSLFHIHDLFSLIVILHTHTYTHIYAHTD